MRIDIIGGGIGGLTTAIALNKKGIKCNVFEQSKELKPVGAGIILASNAMQIFEKLGLKEEIERNGNIISSMNITKPNLSPISKIDLTKFETKYKVKNVAIHRGKLQEILLKKLNTNQINLDCKLKNIENNLGEITLNFENGRKEESSIIIGADGINSTVRISFLPNNYKRNANQICWRGIVDYELPNKYKHELNEVWGKKGRVGFLQISENKVYWYALKDTLTDNEVSNSKNIEDYFKGYNPLIIDIIKSTKKENIHTAELSDLKPSYKWYTENICLIGDAIHATTPNIGQGACQSIESAFVLSECLSKYSTEKAFYEYQKLRIKKAHKVVDTSWLIGKVAHYTNPFAIFFRNLLLRLTPSYFAKKQNDFIFKITEL